jgi:hypothetical protein
VRHRAATQKALSNAPLAALCREQVFGGAALGKLKTWHSARSLVL